MPAGNAERWSQSSSPQMWLLFGLIWLAQVFIFQIYDHSIFTKKSYTSMHLYDTRERTCYEIKLLSWWNLKIEHSYSIKLTHLCYNLLCGVQVECNLFGSTGLAKVLISSPVRSYLFFDLISGVVLVFSPPQKIKFSGACCLWKIIETISQRPFFMQCWWWQKTKKRSLTHTPVY